MIVGIYSTWYPTRPEIHCQQECALTGMLLAAPSHHIKKNVTYSIDRKIIFNAG